MPHIRPRHAVNLFSKRMKYSRVVSIQGARQVGKSFFARELIKKLFLKSEYISLDLRTERDFARDNPRSFIESHEGVPLIIDEAQKAVDLFDAIKWKVDVFPRPGQFVLLGSTEFSKELRIRESLTGRLSRIRLYSMNIGECEQISMGKESLTLLKDEPRVSRAAVLRHLDRGGFPGIFSVHELALRRDALADWIKLTVERDLQQFPKIKVSSDLAFSVLELIARLPEPSNSNIAKSLRCDPRVSQRVLNLLEMLFAIHRLPPHRLGTGKPLYFHCDVSVANYFDGNFERKLWTWVLHEQLSQRSYLGDRERELSYYRTTKGSLIHLVVEDVKHLAPIKILFTERWDNREIEILKAFHKKASGEGKHISLHALGSTRLHLKSPKIEVFPYEALGG